MGCVWASVSMWSPGIGTLLCVYEVPLGRGLQLVPSVWTRCGPPAETVTSQCCFETDKDGSQVQPRLAHPGYQRIIISPCRCPVGLQGPQQWVLEGQACHIPGAWPHLWGSLSSLMLPQMSLALFNKAKNPRLPGAIPRPQPAFTACLLRSRDSSQSSLCVEEETEA